MKARGRRADLVLEDGDGMRWRRLPVPLYRRAWALVTGYQRWVFEGWPV